MEKVLTMATVFPAGNETVIFFRTSTSGRDGYLKLTSSNIMSPTTALGFSPDGLAESMSGTRSIVLYNFAAAACPLVIAGQKIQPMRLRVFEASDLP